jgi:hypothetical protein
MGKNEEDVFVDDIVVDVIVGAAVEELGERAIVAVVVVAGVAAIPVSVTIVVASGGSGGGGGRLGNVFVSRFVCISEFPLVMDDDAVECIERSVSDMLRESNGDC